ncbi:MAG: Mov34/MPN/PAD-1 family protein [Thermoplasmata archaeon]|nr:Mov34/MPN/PAD-1 family protein [Thermoplasmata archaeon]MCI4337949.1 Mov34/MPN/PAD-1 family protein [Thermoplasmata archaeon]MCI4341556.1 Mov34/MPN/PAD-1 family protein [Thermoplasmata archaeon]
MSIFRPARKRSPTEPAPGRTVRSITRRCLDSALACGASSYPNEFGGILRAEPRDTISELLLLPGTTAGRRHANFQLYMLPADLSVAGTVHSHPSGALHPSEADLTLFRHWGRRHLILGSPFTLGCWRAYDGNGREIALEVVGRPLPEVEASGERYRPPRSVHRPEDPDLDPLGAQE